MTLRKRSLAELPPFAYSFGPGIEGRMQDVGRNLGSQSIGLVIQTVRPGNFSSRRHKHVFQEEILVVMAGTGVLHHGDERVPVAAGDCFCYLPEDREPHNFENTGTAELVIWAFGNRFRHEVCLYPDQGTAFVEGLGAEVPLDSAHASDWTEERRKR
ncbi:MAG: cupin domain-containing protein [Acidobacteriota bacterium]